MADLETEIERWRARLAEELPGSPETVRELEEHLREEMELGLRRGLTPAEAFDRARARLGDAVALGREFARLDAMPVALRCRDVLLFAIAPVAAIALATVTLAQGRNVEVLRLTHALLCATGYLAALSAALVGAMLALVPRRALRPELRRTWRAVTVRFSLAGLVLTTAGIGLGMVWAAENLPAAWSWLPVETGALLILVSTALTLLVQRWPGGSDTARGAVAACGVIAVPVGWMGAKAAGTAVPFAALCIAVVAAQAVLARRCRRFA